MPSSGKIRTSAMGYYRGIPKDLHSFAGLMQANYPIVQPQRAFFYDFLRTADLRHRTQYYKQ